MVSRVEGIVNGDPIIFSRVVGDQWEAQVPASLNGTYVLEMTAWDEAGNMANRAFYLLAYDPVNLCASLIPLPYAAAVDPGSWSAAVRLSDYCAQLDPDPWQTETLLSDYYASLEEPACCYGR